MVSSLFPGEDVQSVEGVTWDALRSSFNPKRGLSAEGVRGCERVWYEGDSRGILWDSRGI